MTVMIQASVKDAHGNLYNVKSEADEPDVAWADLGSVLSSIGGVDLAQTVRATLASTLSGEARAVAAAQAGLGATVQQQPPAPAADSWGIPPVPPMQGAPQLPAAAAAPAVGAAPSCHHGTKEFISGVTKSGKNAGKTWKAWACPADRDDPTKCEKEWIRD